MKALLQGRGGNAEVDAVALNTGALLFTAGLAPDLAGGVEEAKAVIASGAAYDRLRAFVEATNA